MKKTLLILIAFASVQMAFASAALELVSGGNTLFVTDAGVVACSGGTCASFGASGDTNPATGAVQIGASNFNGWSITVSVGASNSPGCPAAGSNGVGCMNDTNITAQTSGAGTLSVYFADTGFTTEPGFVVAFSSPQQTGSDAKQTAYAFTGATPLGSGVLAPVPGSGQIGLVLDSPSPGVLATTTGGPGLSGPFNLELATTFTTIAGGGAFNANGNITATPEPASIVLFSGVALLAFGAIRRKMQA